MPTQNTKLVMSKAHITGCMLPHTPTPVPMRYRISTTKIVAHAEAITNAIVQARGGLGASFTRQMSRVTEAKSLWFRTSGARWPGTSMVLSMGRAVTGVEIQG